MIQHTFRPFHPYRCLLSQEEVHDPGQEVAAEVNRKFWKALVSAGL
jgi:hypothetical protein